tara:strand:+ start:3974 stop:4267 length:294 start_codon:yes stop_codon:yes gene_type:complete
MATFQRYEYTSAGTVYTANSTDVIVGILCVNTHATQTSEIGITLSGTDIVKNLEIPVGGSVELVQGKIVAVSGDALTLAIDTGSVAVYVSVLDEAST